MGMKALGNLYTTKTLPCCTLIMKHQEGKNAVVKHQG